MSNLTLVDSLSFLKDWKLKFFSLTLLTFLFISASTARQISKEIQTESIEKLFFSSDKISSDKIVDEPEPLAPDSYLSIGEYASWQYYDLLLHPRNGGLTKGDHWMRSKDKLLKSQLEESQMDASNYFIHEVVDGKYGLIKNVQQGLEIILRSDRIELLRKADPARGIYEVSTYLLFGGSNNVDPKGKEFIESKKIGVKDKYSEESVRFLKSDFIQVHKYRSVVYSDFYDNVDLQVSIDSQNNINFNLLAKDDQTSIPFDLKVWDSNVTSVSDGIMSNGVKITSKTSKMSLNEGKIIFESGNQKRESLSLTLSAITQPF